MVRADTDDVATLTAALSGSYGAFCVTNFFDHMDPSRETQQGRNQADAAAAAGVHHAIWSTLEDTRKFMSLDDDRMPTLMGKYKVPHFDAKGEVDQKFGELGVPTTILRTSYFWENLLRPGALTRGQDGTLALTLPMGNAVLPGLAAEDIGKVALGIFQKGAELIDRTVSISGENLTIAEIAAKLGRALGREVRYNDVPPDVFRSFGFPGAEEFGNMLQFKRDFSESFAGDRDPSVARALNPDMQTFDAWLTANAARLVIE